MAMRKIHTFEHDGEMFVTLNTVECDTLDFYVGFRFLDKHMVELIDVVEYVFAEKKEREVKRYRLSRGFIEDLYLFHKLDKDLGVGYTLLA